MSESAIRASSPVSVMIASSRALRIASVSVLATLIVAPIAIVPYAADDTINRTWANSSWSTSFHNVVQLQRSWINEQGRFFPGSALYTVPMWHILDTRATYLTYVVLLDLACLALLGLVCLRVARSQDVAVIGVVTLGACMQVRWGFHDGLASFGGIVPYTVVLTILSGLGAAQFLHDGRHRWLIPTAILWTLAITTYEVSLLMLPAIIVLLVVANRGRKRKQWTWALTPLVIPAVAEAAISAYLHARATAVAPAYQIHLSGPVGSTFLKQFSAALPSAQYWLGGVPKGVHLYPTLSVMLVLALAVPAFLVWRPHFAAKAIPQRLSIALIAAGAWVWLVPSLLAAVTHRWQDELIFGQGYIYVVYEYVGIALLCAGVAGLLSGTHRSRGARIAVVAMLALVLVGSALTVASNLLFAGQFVPGPHGPT